MESETKTIRDRHGLSGTPEYHIWRLMLSRCQNPKTKCFPSYGGRGIVVCERWNAFTNFLADMGPRPSPKHSIERRNNDLGYSPDNCRWATMREQSRNTRRNVRVTIKGQTRCLSEWVEITGVSYNASQKAIRKGIDPELVFFGPPRQKHADKTHCPKGHPYSGANLYEVPGSKHRMCRACQSERGSKRVRTRRKPIT